MAKGSPSHDALRTVVADRRFLKNIPHYLNARSTADLAGFNNLITMYAGKRYSYVPPIYRARNLLAAIDHNAHLDRQPKLNKYGSTRMGLVFNKKSNRWTLRNEKEKTEYAYIDALMRNVFCQRAEENVGISGPIRMREDDPRRMSAITAPVPPPSKEELIRTQKSRFVQ